MVLALSGCKSAVIGASLTNATGGIVSEVEVDYPSASFGTSTLAAGDAYHYRFEIIGDGPMKASWMDAAHKNHTATGPTISEGQRGTVEITLEPDGTAVWKPQLSR
jgi:hypothetical protein